MKKSRKCSFCHKPGHYSNKCPERHHVTQGFTPKGSKPKNEQEPVAVMRSVIDQFYAIWLVLDGSVSDALVGAVTQGVPTSDALVKGLAELQVRAKKIPADQLARARELRAAHLAAHAAYQTEAQKILVQLGYPEPKS